jgi:hypothetical protein
VKITGSGFADGATVRADDTNLTSTYVSEAELTATVPAVMLAAARVIKVRVDNPDPTAGASAPADLKVTDGPEAGAGAADVPAPIAQAGTETAATPEASADTVT